MCNNHHFSFINILLRNELAFGELSNNTIAINATILKGAYTKSLLYFQNATLDLGKGNITMCPDNNNSSCHYEFENITLKNNNETKRIEGFLNIENKSNNDKKSYEILGVFNLVQSKEYPSGQKISFNY